MARTRPTKPTKYPPRARKPGVARVTVELPVVVARRLLSYCALEGVKQSTVVAEAVRARLRGYEVSDMTSPQLEVVTRPAGERSEATVEGIAVGPDGQPTHYTIGRRA